MSEERKIYIIDSPMGSGKTTAMINYMNNHPEKRFLFVTPFLDEVTRIIDACPELNFKEPQTNERTKTINFQLLIQQNENIATTHALFRLMNEDTMDYLGSRDYVLILDEVIEVVSQETISKQDIEMLQAQGYVSITENGEFHWCGNDYEGRFKNLMQMAKNQELIFYRNQILLWLFPIDTFQCFKKTYILTYQFEGSRLKAYLDLWEEEYEYLHIEDNQIANGKGDDKAFKEKIRILLTVYEGRLNQIGEEQNALSSTWFNDRYSRDNESERLRKNIYNYFRNIVSTSSNERMWSVFSSYKTRYEGNGYTNAFVQYNCRALNAYRDKSVLVYAVNIYENPLIRAWFIEKGAMDYQDKYALSTMIQWIWRSQIRDGKPINLYLPSKRMRKMLNEWLNS